MIVYTNEEVKQFMEGLREKDDWWAIRDSIERWLEDEGKRDGYAFKKAFLGYILFEPNKELKLAFKLLFKLSIKSIPLYMTVRPEDIGTELVLNRYLELINYIVRFRLKLGK